MKEKVISLKEMVGGGYADFWKCKKRYRVVKGSRGSKKSKTTALWIIANMMKKEYSAANTLCVRRVERTLRNSVFSDLKWAIEKLGVSKYWYATVNPMEITYKPTGQKILFRGLDDGLKITSITVDKGCLCWVWVEEAYEITKEDDFNKLDMSIRGEVPDGLFKQITLTLNPWNSQHWIKARFFDVDDDDIFAKTTTFRCNEWLDEADLRLFEKMRINNPRRFRIEGDGEWGISEGLIYENVELAQFDIREVIRAGCGQIKSAFGLDFGFTDPTALICAAVDPGLNKIYVFDEWYKTGTTNREIAEQIRLMGYGGEKIICDSAEPKSIRELQDEGVKAEPSRKGRDSVNHGIQLIQNYQIIVHPKCKEFYREVVNYCWAKDKFDRPTDKPEHDFSHGNDALRYAVNNLLLGDTFSFD